MLGGFKARSRPAALRAGIAFGVLGAVVAVARSFAGGYDCSRQASFAPPS